MAVTRLGLGGCGAESIERPHRHDKTRAPLVCPVRPRSSDNHAHHHAHTHTLMGTQSDTVARRACQLRGCVHSPPRTTARIAGGGRLFFFVCCCFLGGGILCGGMARQGKACNTACCSPTLLHHPLDSTRLHPGTLTLPLLVRLLELTTAAGD